MQKLVERLNKYQVSDFFHPFTCLEDSEHSPLPEADIKYGQVVLICPQCGTIQYQDQIPDMFLTDEYDKWVEEYIKQMENLRIKPEEE